MEEETGTAKVKYPQELKQNLHQRYQQLDKSCSDALRMINKLIGSETETGDILTGDYGGEDLTYLSESLATAKRNLQAFRKMDFPGLYLSGDKFNELRAATERVNNVGNQISGFSTRQNATSVLLQRGQELFESLCRIHEILTPFHSAQSISEIDEVKKNVETEIIAKLDTELIKM